MRDDDPRIRVGTPPPEILARCRFVLSTRGRPVLSQTAVNRLVDACGRPGVGEVGVEGDGVAVTCNSSWALNRTRRWTAGLRPVAELRGLYETKRFTPAELELRDGSPDTPLAW